MSAALCFGKHELFDSTDIEDHRAAKAICATCPTLLECARTAGELKHNAGPFGQPQGTWAGQLHEDGRQITRQLENAERRTERFAAEDARYTDMQSRQAHSAYTLGDRTDWARTGHRVYQRRKKRAQRNRSEGAA